MPTSLTVTGVYNMALDIVADRPCAGPTDIGRAEVRWLNRNYAPYVQAELRRNAWNCATELHALPAGSDPDFRWRHSFTLPNGWLRVLPVTEDALRNGEPIPFEVRRLGSTMVVMTDYSGHASDGLYVELCMDVQDPGEWDPLLAMLISARLAGGMAHSLTHKRSFVDAAKQAVKDALDDAELANAYEGTMAPVEQHDVIRVRSR